MEGDSLRLLYGGAAKNERCFRNSLNSVEPYALLEGGSSKVHSSVEGSSSKVRSLIKGGSSKVRPLLAEGGSNKAHPPAEDDSREVRPLAEDGSSKVRILAEDGSEVTEEATRTGEATEVTREVRATEQEVVTFELAPYSFFKLVVFVLARKVKNAIPLVFVLMSSIPKASGTKRWILDLAL